MPSMETADQVFAETVDALAKSLCPDCPIRNWCGQVAVETIGVTAESDADTRIELAMSESQLIASMATAAFIKLRDGCDGKQESEEPCECCGNDGACMALATAQEYIESNQE